MDLLHIKKLQPSGPTLASDVTYESSFRRKCLGHKINIYKKTFPYSIRLHYLLQIDKREKLTCVIYYIIKCVI